MHAISRHAPSRSGHNSPGGNRHGFAIPRGPRGIAGLFVDIIFPMRVIGIAGWSGAGKTTLLAKLIPRLTARSVSVSTVKHAHHGFDLDQPGKDSHVHRMAGATEVLVSSANRWALVHELRGSVEMSLGDLLAKLAPVDLVIVEGFKRGSHPKLEVFRAAVGKPLLHPGDPHIVAVASDAPLPAARVPVVALDDIDAIADLVLARAAPIEAFVACGGSR
jgi:molybdopterin-guanine dinucleotide biosynthesis adapter protein